MWKPFFRIVCLFVAAVILASCAAERYLAQRTDISPTVREAILQKRVILGMFPDEAHAAAGQFVYSVTPGKKRREIEKRSGTFTDPLYVIFSQRTHPDSTHIEMTFRNSSQFKTSQLVSFTVTFRQGRAVSITRNPQ